MDKLSKYINEAKAINKETSPLSEIELRSIMDNCDDAQITNPKFNFKKGIIMGSIISTFLMLVLLGSNFMLDANKNETGAKTQIATNRFESTNKTESNNNIIYDSVAKEKNSTVENTDEDNENIINGGNYILNFNSSNSENNTPKTTADSLQQILRMIDNKNDNIEIPILRYNNKLGKLLGIKMDGDIFTAKVKSNFYEIEDFWGYDLRKYNYAKPDIYHPAIVKYDYRFSLKDSCKKYKVNIHKYDKL